MVETEDIDTKGKYHYYNTYMTIDRSKAGAAVKILYKRDTARDDRNDLLLVGDNYAVFSDMVNSKLVARGVNLRNGENFVLGERNYSCDNFVSFIQDTLVMRDVNNYWMLRSFVRTP